MNGWTFKRWRVAGAAAAAVGLAACGGEGGEGAGGEAGHGEAGEAAVSGGAQAGGGEAGEAARGESGGEHGEAGVASAYAGLEGDQRTALRLQHLKGFVLAAEQIATTGKSEEAAIVLQQGLLEVYDPAADQFSTLNVAILRDAANLDTAAQGLGGRLDAAEAEIDRVLTGLEVDYAVLTARMADIATGLYQNVVQPDVVDPVEYQHSMGAARAAQSALALGRATLHGRNARAYAEAERELARFAALWPAAEAPEQPSQAATYRDVLAQSSRVRLALSPYL